ncbi:hypothetical protein N9X60_05075 [Paracoccaceae bacterium]|nr:hypothetical protein [Paracoccaceae bacterium]
MSAKKARSPFEPLIWGDGKKLFEIFLEPTCPFSARTFFKFDDFLSDERSTNITLRIWLHSQPWHVFSGILCRVILGASMQENGKAAAKAVMGAIFANKEEFELHEHRTGPLLLETPMQLISKVERITGLSLVDDFQSVEIDAEVKRHTKYSRQNGIHSSPTFMVDGLVNSNISSGDPIEKWLSEMN